MKIARWSLFAALVLLLVLVFTTDGGGGASDFTRFLGRFHPSLVHLPIGILLLALLLEGLMRTPRFEAFATLTPMVWLAGAWSAILAAFAGLYLSQGGGYDPETLVWHKRLGVAVAVLAVAAYGLRNRSAGTQRLSWGYGALLASLFLGVTIGGHLGGTLTHGEGYLTRYMPDALRSVAGLPSKEDLGRLTLEDPENTPIYASLIQPIFDARCASCHNPNKKKGGLVLDSGEGLLEGGDDGDVLVAGRAAESEVIRRIWLPATHEDHMPPEGRPPLTVAEAELLRWWIDQGASFEQTLAEAEQTPAVKPILDGYGLDEIRTGIFALDVPPPDSAAVAALRALGLGVMPLAEQEPFLQVRCPSTGACLSPPQVEALRPLAPHIAWLDLGRTPVGDSALAVVSTLPHLTRLHLEQTAITDAALAYLDGLQYLEYLNLYGTRVSDEGLQHLSGLPALKALYLWQTGVTEAGVERLQQIHPHLDVNLGLTFAPPVTPAGDTSE